MTEAEIALRNLWFLNGCMFNSEVWIGYSQQDIHALEVIDHQILRLITGAQAKSPVEMLYLETEELPIKSVMSVRRLMYLHTILKRSTKELTFKVYMAMKNNHIKGDWIEKIKEDLEDIGMNLDMEKKKKYTKSELRKIVKQGIRKKLFYKTN